MIVAVVVVAEPQIRGRSSVAPTPHDFAGSRCLSGYGIPDCYRASIPGAASNGEHRLAILGKSGSGRRAMYRIREVDGQDEEVADALAELHRLIFHDTARIPDFDSGHWWLACHDKTPIAFAGVTPSTRVSNGGYFNRVGVIRKHRGRGLQLRLMRAMESRARNNGWTSVVSDTTDNVASANNFIRAGYRLYRPQHPWAWPNTLYWRKSICH
jgi:GNAT superfamily N-acetyltransferase